MQRTPMPSNLFQQQACTDEGCDSLALPLSQPPLCGGHIPNLDAWYETALVSIAAREEGGAVSGLGFVHDIYRYALVSNGLQRTIYREFEEHKRAGRSTRFSFHDLIFFIVTAAAAGVIGGLSYDGLKRVIRKITVAKAPRNDALDTLPNVVSEQRYKELAERFQVDIVLETEEAIEVRLRRTYRLVMKVNAVDNKTDA